MHKKVTLSDFFENILIVLFDKPFRPYIRLSFSNIIMLALEGKMMAETYGRQFRFFQYCIQKAFGEFSLAKAVRIDLTG